jgi:hypothetical protein
MSCCGGQRRSMINMSEEAFWKGKAIRVRYIGARPITVLGPATGQRYTFSGLQRYQDVDPKDAMDILRSSFFRVEGVVRRAEG